MKFMCIKTEPIEHDLLRRNMFTKGKIYEEVVDSYEKNNYCVIDDEGDRHWIGKPRDWFFDERFEIVDDGMLYYVIYEDEYNYSNAEFESFDTEEEACSYIEELIINDAEDCDLEQFTLIKGKKLRLEEIKTVVKIKVVEE